MINLRCWLSDLPAYLDAHRPMAMTLCAVLQPYAQPQAAYGGYPGYGAAAGADPYGGQAAAGGYGGGYGGGAAAAGGGASQWQVWLMTWPG